MGGGRETFLIRRRKCRCCCAFFAREVVLRDQVSLSVKYGMIYIMNWIRQAKDHFHLN
jgi:hypothetical protein